MLPGDLFCGAKEESFEGFLEVLVEGDVDDRVDHGVRVGEHVDPEGVSEKKKNTVTIIEKVIYTILFLLPGELRKKL